MGIFERGGKVYAVPVKDTKSETLFPIMLNVVDKKSTIYTDEWGSYNPLGKVYAHSIVNHRAEEFVRGSVHTNSIESFWALLKRGLTGIYHHTSDEHLSRYVNEFTFRFNNRKLSEGSKFDVCLANTKGRLDYKTLKSKR